MILSAHLSASSVSKYSQWSLKWRESVGFILKQVLWAELHFLISRINGSSLDMVMIYWGRHWDWHQNDWIYVRINLRSTSSPSFSVLLLHLNRLGFGDEGERNYLSVLVECGGVRGREVDTDAYIISYTKVSRRVLLLRESSLNIETSDVFRSSFFRLLINLKACVNKIYLTCSIIHERQEKVHPLRAPARLYISRSFLPALFK